jgi:hypothetical protein
MASLLGGESPNLEPKVKLDQPAIGTVSRKRALTSVHPPRIAAVLRLGPEKVLGDESPVASTLRESRGVIEPPLFHSVSCAVWHVRSGRIPDAQVGSRLLNS